jgi:RND family efflux transporter MFP subunit
VNTERIMNAKNLLLAAAALAVIPFLAACGGGHSEPAADAAAAPMAPADARRGQAERLTVPRNLDLYGTLEAERTAAVSSRVMAQVTGVRAAAGDAVRRGQTLVLIDPQAARGQLSQAQGALAQARAARTLAERNYERFQALAEADAASELELDMARMQAEQARGAVEQAEGAVSAASSVASDSTVTAPFDGRVVRRMVEVGDLAAPGRPLMMIESLGPRRAVLQVPESAVASSGLGLGSPVTVRIDSRPDLGALDGTVAEMSPGADPLSHAYEVKVALPQTAGEPLASGTAVRASLPLGERQVVAVDADAVLRRGGLDLVVLVDGEGRTSSRAVTVGAPLADGRLEILSGLDGGETVLLGLSAVPTAERVEG